MDFVFDCQPKRMFNTAHAEPIMPTGIIQSPVSWLFRNKDQLNTMYPGRSRVTRGSFQIDRHALISSMQETSPEKTGCACRKDIFLFF